MLVSCLASTEVRGSTGASTSLARGWSSPAASGRYETVRFGPPGGDSSIYGPEVIVTTADGVPLAWERSGSGPTVLLVPGRGDSSDLFPVDFTSRLTDGGLSVVRFDPRDTGLSGDGGDTYSLRTMVDDAIAVLDAAGVERAHLVGVSMGGIQLVDLATRYPERTASLTFVSAMSPDPDAGIGEDFFAAFAGDPLTLRMGAMGDVEDQDRAWAALEVDRAERRAPARPDAVARHQEAAFRAPWPSLDDLASIASPTVVVHGKVDRVLPIAHAHALTAIPGATLELREGMGHLPRQSDWTAIADHVIHLGAR